MLSFIKDKQTYFFLLLLVSIGVGLQSVIYKIAIIALLLQWILTADYKQKFIKLKQNNFAVGLIGLYFLYAISFFWSDNEAAAVFDMILKTPLLILPLVVFSQSPFSAKQINQLLLSFALSILVLNLFCLGDAYFSYTAHSYPINKFFYNKLVINMHPAYQAMFTCFSIVIFVYLFVKERLISNWIACSLVAIQMIFILLLSSRMQILIMMGIIPVYFITYYYQKKKTFIGVLYVALIFGLLYILMSLPTSLNSRYKQMVAHINSIGVNHANFDPRELIWPEGLEVIKDNWLIGVGSGDARDVLAERYSKLILDNPTSDHLVDSTIFQIQKNEKDILYLKEKKFKSNINYEKQLRDYTKSILKSINHQYSIAFEKRYNFHNQYLQTFGTVGIFGLVILSYLLCYPLILLIRDKDYLGILFLAIIGVSFLTESMFERQAGIVFFTFFYVLLIVRASQNKLF